MNEMLPDWIQVTNGIVLILTLFVIYVFVRPEEYKNSQKNKTFEGSYRKWLIETKFEDYYYFPIKNKILRRFFLIWIIFSIPLTFIP